MSPSLQPCSWLHLLRGWSLPDSRGGSVHPHARGEHYVKARRLAVWDGSSPRTWGTHERSGCSARAWRFIPTHVGNTRLSSKKPVVPSVHPHARGEHHRSARRGDGKDGSSPRTWGTLVEIGVVLPGRRFIPTHVGNTRTVARESSFSSVHPHARGEHATIRRLKPPADGSSPRTWGTHRP